MEKQQIIVLDPRRVPEVMAFLEVEARITAFRKEFGPILNELHALIEQRNAALVAADKVLRPRHASCGPFRCTHVSVKYDAVALYQAVGEEMFLRLGGAIQKTVEYKLDRERFEEHIHEVPPDVLALIRAPSPAYKMPKPAALP